MIDWTLIRWWIIRRLMTRYELDALRDCCPDHWDDFHVYLDIEEGRR